MDEAQKQSYTQYNRAFSWGHSKSPSAIMLHEPTLQVMAGKTW